MPVHELISFDHIVAGVSILGSTVRSRSGLRKNHDPVRRDDNRSGRTETVHWAAARIDTGAVTRYLRIHPVVIDVAVEDFSPKPRHRETQIITPPGAFSEGRYDYNVSPNALEPPMKSKHAIAVRAVKWVDLVTA